MIQKLLINNNNITEKSAIEFLEKKGYTVIKNNTFEGKDLIDIINYFYSNLNKLYDRLGYSNIVTVSYKTDLIVLKKFLNQNIKLGIKKIDALNNLQILVELFFKYYSDLKLTDPITNMKFLLTDGSWILDKIKIIHRRKIEEYRDSFEMEQWRNRLYEEEDAIIQKLREQRHLQLLGDIKDGKKENN